MLIAAALVTASPSAAQEGMSVDIGPISPQSANHDKFPFAGGGGNYVQLSYERKRDIAPVVLLLPGLRARRLDWQYDIGRLTGYLVDKGFVVASIEPNWGRTDRPRRNRRQLAQAIGEIVRQAARWRYDPQRMVLVGVGLSGRDAAVFGTDPHWLQQEGVAFASLRGVVILNGDQVDPGAANGENDPAFAEAIAPPNAPRFLLHSVKGDDRRSAEAKALADALRAAGALVELRPVGPSMSKSDPSMIGGANNPENDRLLRFLKDATAQPVR